MFKILRNNVYTECNIKDRSDFMKTRKTEILSFTLDNPVHNIISLEDDSIWILVISIVIRKLFFKNKYYQTGWPLLWGAKRNVRLEGNTSPSLFHGLSLSYVKSKNRQAYLVKLYCHLKHLLYHAKSQCFYKKIGDTIDQCDVCGNLCLCQFYLKYQDENIIIGWINMFFQSSIFCHIFGN